MKYAATYVHKALRKTKERQKEGGGGTGKPVKSGYVRSHHTRTTTPTPAAGKLDVLGDREAGAAVLGGGKVG